MPPPTLALRREPMACRNVSRPSWGPDDQHVGRPGRRLPVLLLRVLLLRVLLLRVLLLRFRGRRRGLAQHAHRGLVRGQHVLPGQGREHRLIEPGRFQPRAHPGGGLTGPARRDLGAEQHADEPRGPLRRHVPVRGQQHGGRVQDRPAGHAARVQARRRLRERHRPAARARKDRQQPLGHLPEDLDVGDLRPPRARGLRAVQAGPAGPAFRRRPAVFVSPGSGSRFRPFPW
jgi:hypothetical protein